jgi:hypothetical protein
LRSANLNRGGDLAQLVELRLRESFAAEDSTARYSLGGSRSLNRGALGTIIDRLTEEGRFLRCYEKMLIEALGGTVDAIQRQLIARAARLALYLERLDEAASSRCSASGTFVGDAKASA